MNRTIIVLIVAAVAIAVGLSGVPGAGANPSAQRQDAPDAPIEWVQNPDKDTYVVNGDDEPLGFEKYLRGGAYNKNDYVTLIHFEIPEIVEKSVMTKATLKLWCYEMEHITTSRPQLEIRENNSNNWTEAKTVWSNAPNATGAAINWEIFEEECDDTWVSIDLTETVERWVLGTRNNNGFYIHAKFQDDDMAYLFQAKDHASPYPRGNQPQLVFEIVPPPTNTPLPTDTPTASSTPTASNTPTVTDTPSVTFTPSPTNTPIPTDTPTPTATPTGPPPVFMPIALNMAELVPPPEPTDEMTPESSETPEATVDPGEPTVTNGPPPLTEVPTTDPGEPTVDPGEPTEEPPTEPAPTTEP